MKIEYKQKPTSNQIDSFWYDGECAILEHNRRRCMIAAVGEKALYNKEGELIHDNYKERGPIEVNDDDSLHSLEKHGCYWEMNNWFDIWWEVDDTWECDLAFIAHDYSEAIQVAIYMLTDKDCVKDLWEVHNGSTQEIRK